MESTALIAIHPEIQEEIISLRAEGERLYAYTQGFVVAGLGDAKRAVEDLSLISNLKKALEERRKEYTQPLNAHLKEINEAFKGMVTPIELADATLRGKVGAYNREQERLRQEAERARALREEALTIEAKLTQQTGEIFPETAPAVVMPEFHPATKVFTDVGYLNTRKVRKYRVINFSLLPDEYKLEDSVKLGKVVRAGINSIPGVEIYEEDSLVITSKKVT